MEVTVTSSYSGVAELVFIDGIRNSDVCKDIVDLNVLKSAKKWSK